MWAFSEVYSSGYSLVTNDLPNPRSKYIIQCPKGIMQNCDSPMGLCGYNTMNGTYSSTDGVFHLWQVEGVKQFKYPSFFSNVSGHNRMETTYMKYDRCWKQIHFRSVNYVCNFYLLLSGKGYEKWGVYLQFCWDIQLNVYDLHFVCIVLQIWIPISSSHVTVNQFLPLWYEIQSCYKLHSRFHNMLQCEDKIVRIQIQPPILLGHMSPFWIYIRSKRIVACCKFYHVWK